MIIYNKTWFTNLQIHHDAETQRQRGYISKDELKKIQAKYPVGFYTPNIFARIGLFILTCIATSFAGGLVTLMLADLRIFDSFIWVLFLGLSVYMILEIMTKSNHYYRAGVDDALLYISASLLTGGFIWMLDGIRLTALSESLSAALFIGLLSTILALRFADLLMSSIAALSVFAIVFFVWQYLGSFGTATMPFIIMLTAAALYYFTKYLERIDVNRFYENNLKLVKLISLVLLYAAGNYFVVQQLSDELHPRFDGKSTPIAFGWFFWIWTFVLPAVYLYFSIRKKNQLLLRLSLVLFVAAVLTFRYYHQLLPPELALTIAGALMLLLVYGIIKYLKTPKHGFTYVDIDNEGKGHIQIESLIIGEAFSDLPAAPQQPDDIFGGGSAGGAGSSSSF